MFRFVRFVSNLGLVYETHENKDVRRLPLFCDLFTFAV